MYRKNGDLFTYPLQACAHLRAATKGKVLVNPHRKDIRAVLESYGYEYQMPAGYRRIVDKWNAKLKRKIRHFFMWIGSFEKYFR